MYYFWIATLVGTCVQSLLKISYKYLFKTVLIKDRKKHSFFFVISCRTLLLKWSCGFRSLLVSLSYACLKLLFRFFSVKTKKLCFLLEILFSVFHIALDFHWCSELSGLDSHLSFLLLCTISSSNSTSGRDH